MVMDSGNASIRLRLEHVEALLRQSVAGFRPNKGRDRQTLERMICCLAQIHRALSVEPEYQSSAQRRLHDFAGMALRMSSRHPLQGDEFKRIAIALQVIESSLSANSSSITEKTLPKAADETAQLREDRKRMVLAHIGLARRSDALRSAVIMTNTRTCTVRR